MAEPDGLASAPAVAELLRQLTEMARLSSSNGADKTNDLSTGKDTDPTIKCEETHCNETSRQSPLVEESDHLQITIDRVRAVTIKAPLTIQGTFTKGIIDTGAEVTVLSERLYNLIPKDKKPPLQKARRGLVVADAGREMKTCGIAEVEFSIGDYSFIWPVYVALIRDDLLLGCDLIDEMNITVNTKRGIQIEDKWIDCEVIRSHDSTAQVKVSRAVTVPANSEFIMRGQCNSAITQENCTCIFRGNGRSAREVINCTECNPAYFKQDSSEADQSSLYPGEAKKGSCTGYIATSRLFNGDWSIHQYYRS